MNKPTPQSFTLTGTLALMCLQGFCQHAAVAQGPASNGGRGNVTFENPAEAPAGPLNLWYRQPARQWEEALPVGNGRLGAMVFGDVAREHLQINEDTFWKGSPYNQNN